MLVLGARPGGTRRGTARCSSPAGEDRHRTVGAAGPACLGHAVDGVVIGAVECRPTARAVVADVRAGRADRDQRLARAPRPVHAGAVAGEVAALLPARAAVGGEPGGSRAIGGRVEVTAHHHALAWVTER